MDGGFAALFSDYTLRTVALGAAAVGFTSGALGSFAVLRRQSLLGDAISHAALPGIAVAFLLTTSKAPLVLMSGAALAGWLATLAVLGVVRTTRVKEDAALGLVLSAFFGSGLVLLTFIQKLPIASQAGLDKFLFGQASTLLAGDVATIAAVGAAAVALLLVFWKELKIATFDPGFAASLGFPVRMIDVVLFTLLVLAIVVGLQTVGVVLMSALLVAPGAAARQWTDRLWAMVLLAGGFGAASGLVGAVISSLTPRLATGPTVVLCAVGIAVVSLLLAPARGLVWRHVRQARARRRLGVAAVLGDLADLARQHADAEHAHPESVLVALRGRGRPVRRALAELAERGLARRTAGGWTLTPQGRDEAARDARHRGGER